MPVIPPRPLLHALLQPVPVVATTARPYICSAPNWPYTLRAAQCTIPSDAAPTRSSLKRFARAMTSSATVPDDAFPRYCALRLCAGTVVMVRSVALTRRPQGRHLVYESAGADAIDVCYEQRSNEPSGVWFEYDDDSDSSRVVSVPVELIESTKEDRDSVGAAGKHGLWEIRPI